MLTNVRLAGGAIVDTNERKGHAFEVRGRGRVDVPRLKVQAVAEIVDPVAIAAWNASICLNYIGLACYR